jgi:two-component system, response regulator, stage 0 sporulation protein F
MSSPQTVLIVDDNDNIRFVLRQVLTGEDYTTLEAADGMEAVNTLRRSSDRLIVLLDLSMPGMSGLDVLNLMNASKELARHVYIVMAADERNLDAAHAALPTRRDIPLMQKPFELDDLLGEVARAASRLS